MQRISVIAHCNVMSVAKPLTGIDKFCCSYFMRNTLSNQLVTREIHFHLFALERKGFFFPQI